MDAGAVENLPTGEIQLVEKANLTDAAQAAACEQARFREGQGLQASEEVTAGGTRREVTE